LVHNIDGLVFRGLRPGDYHDHLPFWLALRPLHQLGQRATHGLFEFLSQLATDGCLPFGTEDGERRLQRFEYAVWALEEDHGSGLVSQRLPEPLTLALLARQEALEAESVGWQTAHGQRGQHSRRTWYHRHVYIGGYATTDQLESRVAHRGHPGIGDHEQVVFARDFNQLRDAITLVMLVQREGLGIYANTQCLSKLEQGSGVFRGDVVMGLQGLHQAWRGVAEVTNGCCSQNKHSSFWQNLGITRCTAGNVGGGRYDLGVTESTPAQPPRTVAAFRRLLPNGYWLVTLLAGFLRFYNLGYPKVLVFDETYYVKDAWSLWHNGFESSWGSRANEFFQNGHPNHFLDTGSFVVHPPLGKWLIAAPMALFGAGNSWTWRFTVALLGTAAVLLLMLVAKKLTGSQSFAVLTGLLFAIDGHAIVLSRVSLLDGILAFFVLLAFYFLLIDREKSRARYQVMSMRAGFGVIWNRPWLVATALALGLATSVKWSGAYFALFFGAYVVVSELLLRRRLGMRHWLSDGLIGQPLANLALMVPVYLATYLANWLGWILTSGGWGRDSKDNWWQSLIYYHQQIYGFHVGLHTPHAYASNPLTWLFMGRPVAFWYESSQCPPNPNGCSAAIQAIGNPFIWWGAFAALIWLTYSYFVGTYAGRGRPRTRGDRTIGLILLGVAAGYLPWLMYMGRTVFQFYAIAFEPFLILGLVYALRSLWYSGTRWRRSIVVYLSSVCLVSVFFLNLWWGFVTPYWFWLSHMWLGNLWI